jgi:hypothetical protein
MAFNEMLWKKPKIRLEQKAATNTLLYLAIKEV